MPTISLLLKSTYDSAGADAAINSLKTMRDQIAESLKLRSAEGGVSGLAGMGIDPATANEAAQVFKQITAAQIEAGRAALTHKDGGLALAETLTAEARESLALARQMEFLAQNTDKLRMSDEQLAQEKQRLIQAQAEERRVQIDKYYESVSAAARTTRVSIANLVQGMNQYGISVQEVLQYGLKFSGNAQQMAVDARTLAQRLRESAASFGEVGAGTEEIARVNIAEQLERMAQGFENVARSGRDSVSVIQTLANAGVNEGFLAFLDQSGIPAGAGASVEALAEKSIGLTEALEHEIKTLEKRNETLQKAEAVAAASGNDKRAKAIGALSKQVEGYIKNLQKMVELEQKRNAGPGLSEQQKAAQLFQQLTAAAQNQATSIREVTNAFQQENIAIKDAVLQNIQYDGTLDGLQAALDELEADLRKTAAAAIEQKEALEAVRRTRVADNIHNISNSFNSLRQEADPSIFTRVRGGLDNMIDGLNRAGFALFLITMNFRTVQMLAQGAFNAIKEGAKSLDILEITRNNVQGLGQDFEQFNDRLWEASHGLIQLREAQSLVNSAIQAGTPEVAKMVPELETMAVGMAEMSGDLELATENLSTLTRALSEGNPELLKQTGHLAFANQVIDTYNFRVERAGEENLSASEKADILADIIRDLGGEFTEAGQTVDSMSSSLISFEQGLGDVRITIDQVLAAGLAAELLDIEEGSQGAAEWVDALGDRLKGFASNAFLAGQAAAGLNEILLKLPGTLALGGFDAVGDLVERVFSQVLEDSGEFNDIIFGATETAQEAINEGGGSGESIFSRLGEDAKNALGPMSSFEGQLGDMIGTLEYITSDAFQAILDIEDIWDDYDDKIAEIIDRRDERIEDAKKKASDKIRKIEDDLADDIEDINDKLADDLADAQEKAAEDRIEAEEDYQDKREKIERDHQRRLRDIIRKFELSRLSAVIDRDARALFEAERRKDEEIATENEKYADKIAEVDDGYKEELDEIEEWEEKKTKELEEAAQDRIKAAQEEADKRIAEAERNRDEQIKIAEDEAKKQKKIAHDRAKEAERQVKEDYNRRELMTRAGEMLTTGTQLQGLIDKYGDLETYVGDAIELLEDYETWYESFYDNFGGGRGPLPVPVPDGDGGNNDDGDDGGPAPPPPPSGTTPDCNTTKFHNDGGACNYSESGKTYTCPNGSIWKCQAGRWIRQNGIGTSGPSVSTTSSTAPVGGVVTPAGGQTRLAATLVLDTESFNKLMSNQAAQTFIEIVTEG